MSFQLVSEKTGDCDFASALGWGACAHGFQPASERTGDCDHWYVEQVWEWCGFQPASERTGDCDSFNQRGSI
jgi:hypothetical protein